MSRQDDEENASGAEIVHSRFCASSNSLVSVRMPISSRPKIQTTCRPSSPALATAFLPLLRALSQVLFLGLAMTSWTYPSRPRSSQVNSLDRHSPLLDAGSLVWVASRCDWPCSCGAQEFDIDRTSLLAACATRRRDSSAARLPVLSEQIDKVAQLVSGRIARPGLSLCGKMNDFV
jgi:hypothetical protein